MTITTSSLCPRWNELERNSAPTTGMVPSAGIFEPVCEELFSIRPAIAKLWPLARSTVVSARRVVSDGTSDCPSKCRSLTSVPTMRLIRSPSTTVGVKLSPMPKSLNSVLVPSSLTVWYGNSPPARKVADSPERAVRFGSAMMVTRPSSASACSTTSMLKLPRVAR